MAEVSKKGVRVPFIELEGCAEWALERGRVGRGGVSPKREGKKSMVHERDGGNKEVTDKGE
jgi:hypothetical protein